MDKNLPRTIIFANGDLPDLEAARRIIQPDDTIIAADGGTRHALALGLTPSIVVGDLDSLTDDIRKKIAATGARIISYPRDKNETDLELALRCALDSGCHAIVIIAALGSRLDQALANLSLLTVPALAEADVRLDDGVEEAFFVRNQAEVRGSPGDLVSLIPWGAPVTGVVTAGLKWPLSGETLYPDKTRGVSNEMLGDVASVSIDAGLLLCIHSRPLLNLQPSTKRRFP